MIPNVLLFPENPTSKMGFLYSCVGICVGGTNFRNRQKACLLKNHLEGKRYTYMYTLSKRTLNLLRTQSKWKTIILTRFFIFQIIQSVKPTILWSTGWLSVVVCGHLWSISARLWPASGSTRDKLTLLYCGS